MYQKKSFLYTLACLFPLMSLMMNRILILMFINILIVIMVNPSCVMFKIHFLIPRSWGHSPILLYSSIIILLFYLSHVDLQWTWNWILWLNVGCNFLKTWIFTNKSFYGLFNLLILDYLSLLGLMPYFTSYSFLRS